jgi:hypothetical protein
MSKGKDFEKAVYEFVKSLSPTSKVYFDYKVLDRDTGTTRQVDVWIETTILDHFPISILVSCKDYKRPLDIGHVGTFREEVRSSGASTGIIYSRSGFSKPALKKAKTNGLSCCKLYNNSPADKPEILVFESYVCAPRVEFDVTFNQAMEGISTWGDVYDQKEEGTGLTIFEKIYHEVSGLETEVKENLSGFPKQKNAVFEVNLGQGKSLSINLRLGYRYYKGKLEAHLVNGSYCFSNEKFKGSLSTPVIDMKSVHPGPGWEEIQSVDDSLSFKAIAILSGGKPDESQIEAMKRKRLIINNAI